MGTKKEKKKKKKQEQSNRKNSSESDDKRYCEENRSSVESTTMSEEESSVAINDSSLEVEKAESELPVELEEGVSEVRRMTKAEKKNAKKEKKRIQQQADEREEKKTCEAIVELCDNKTEKEEEEEDKDNGYSSDITFDNKRNEISLDFEDMGGNWEEASKGKKKKKKQDEKRKVQMADLVQELENRRMDVNNGGRREYCGQSKIPTESPELSDEPEAVNNENKENSFVNGKL